MLCFLKNNYKYFYTVCFNKIYKIEFYFDSLMHNFKYNILIFNDVLFDKAQIMTYLLRKIKFKTYIKGKTVSKFCIENPLII